MEDVDRVNLDKLDLNGSLARFITLDVIKLITEYAQSNELLFEDAVWKNGNLAFVVYSNKDHKRKGFLVSLGFEGKSIYTSFDGVLSSYNQVGKWLHDYLDDDHGIDSYHLIRIEAFDGEPGKITLVKEFDSVEWEAI